MVVCWLQDCWITTPTKIPASKIAILGINCLIFSLLTPSGHVYIITNFDGLSSIILFLLYFVIGKVFSQAFHKAYQISWQHPLHQVYLRL